MIRARRVAQAGAAPWLLHRAMAGAPRCCSSSSSSDVQLENGLPLLLSTLWRCAKNSSEFDRWEDENLVPSTLSLAKRYRLFALLHTPSRLEFNADEFLRGAKPALEQLILATKSRGFATHVQSGGVENNEDVDRVRAFCAPRGLEFHVDVTQQALDRQMIIEAEHVDVESVQLNECVYGQVTQREFEQELQGKRQVINEATENATLERLFISVKATVNERLRRELIGEEAQVLEQKNVYFAVLASNVTTPDVVDWAFVANVLGNTLRSNELSREAL